MENAGIVTEQTPMNPQEMIAGIKGAFDQIKAMPLADDQKLGIAKTGLAMGILNALGQKLQAGQTVSPQGQARLQKTTAAVKQATSIDQVEQALIDAINNYASTM
jgi:hypothetical protein